MKQEQIQERKQEAGENPEVEDSLRDFLNEGLYQMILSNPRKSEIRKIKIRPLLIKGVLFFQASSFEGTKVFHENYGTQSLLSQLGKWLAEYRQLEADNEKEHLTILISKKGKAKVLKKKQKQKLKQQDLSHNREKQYLLEEGVPVPFLIDLGVMTPEGKVVSKKYDKFRQINRYLEFIRDILPELPKGRELNIIDFGCGKSYLTFAMYYYLKEKMGYDIRVTGLDLKADVIMNCNLLAQKYGYEKCRFEIGDIGRYQGTEQADMVVTLHACDTATDFALEKAVRWNAKVILSVPCCQHELNRQIEQEVLEPVLKYGIIKERMAALFTDAIRAELLRQQGYDVQILEFIDIEHTPKNLLIRAVRRNQGMASEDKKEAEKLEQLEEFLHVHPMLSKCLQQHRE